MSDSLRPHESQHTRHPIQDITIAELIEGYMGSLCITSNNCICIYSYLKIRSVTKNMYDPFADGVYSILEEKSINLISIQTQQKFNYACLLSCLR